MFTNLFQELGLSLSDPADDLKIIELERELRHSVEALRAKKEERLREVVDMKKEDRAVARAIGAETFHISGTNIPTPGQMDAFRKHLKEIKVGKTSRNIHLLNWLNSLNCKEFFLLFLG